MKGLSVVVTCFNTGRYIVDAVQSVALQCNEMSYEIVIVDDASTDRDTSEALAAVDRLPNVMVARNPRNKGSQVSRNLGLSLSTMPYVAMLDGDDYFDFTGQKHPRFLTFATNVLSERTDVAFVQCMSRMCGQFEGLTISAYPLREDLVVRKHHVPTSIVYRRADVENGARYDEEISKWQDWSFAVSLLAARWRCGLRNEIVFLHDAQHRYRIHSRDDRVSASDVDEYEMVLRTVAKYKDYFEFFYSGRGSLEELAREVLGSKPCRLRDLLFMAAFDLRQALSVVDERRFELVSPFAGLGIP